MALIDLSLSVFAIHQNHTYVFKGFKSSSSVELSKDGLLNKNIVKNRTLNLLDTNYVFKNDTVKKKKSEEFMNRNMGKLPIIFPEFGALLVIYKKTYRRIKKYFNK